MPYCTSPLAHVLHFPRVPPCTLSFVPGPPVISIHTHKLSGVDSTWLSVSIFETTAAGDRSGFYSSLADRGQRPARGPHCAGPLEQRPLEQVTSLMSTRVFTTAVKPFQVVACGSSILRPIRDPTGSCPLAHVTVSGSRNGSVEHGSRGVEKGSRSRNSSLAQAGTY